LRCLGWQLRYEPRALVRRPHRRGLGELLHAVFRYGRGRTAQARCLPSGVTLSRLGLASIACAGVGQSLLGFTNGSLLLSLPAFLYSAYLLILTLRLSLRSRLTMGLAGGPVSALVHASYVLGILRGLISPFPLNDSDVLLEQHVLKTRAPPRGVTKQFSNTHAHL
jgi:hypothetical protein